MLSQNIAQMQDGLYPVNLECPADEIPDMFPEFSGSRIVVSGNVRRVGKRFLFNLEVSSIAHLVCDLSLEHFDERISSQFEVLFIADSDLRLLAGISGNEPYVTDSDEHIIRSDVSEIDISDIVREELCAALPLKRIAPQYAGKDISDIFPDLSCIVQNDNPTAASGSHGDLGGQLTELIKNKQI